MNKKKFMSLILALVMMIGAFSPLTAMAEDAVKVPTGVLSADQLSETKPTETEIDIYKLTTQQNYKTGAPWEHTGGKIADTKILGTDVKPLEGAKFTFYKIDVPVVANTQKTDGTEAKNQAEADKLNEKYFNILKANPANFESAKTMNDIMTKGYPTADGATKTIPAGVIKLATGTGLTNGQTAATNADGLATVKLPDGYYWAVESVKPDKVTSAIAVPFGLTLPLMNGKDVTKTDGTVAKAGTHYLSKIYIYPKNIQTDDVLIDKDHANYDETKGKWVDKDGNEVKSADLGIKYADYQREKKAVSRELGQDSPFQSDTTIPRNYTFEEFSWTDVMSEGLTYNKGTLKVTIDYVDADGTTKLEKQPFIDLTAQTKVGESMVTERDNGFDVHVKKTDVTTTLVEYLKRGPVTFHFSYSAKVNKLTVVDKPQSNSITFEKDKPSGGGKVTSKDLSIEIVKTWVDKDGQAQANIKAQDITYYLAKVENNVEKTVASVTVKAGTAANTKIPAGQGIEFVVGDKLGSGKFTGLPADGEYVIREAVNGYKPTYTPDNTNGKMSIENKDKPEVKKPSEPKVVFHGKKFVKTDQLNNEERLFGAEFVVRRETATKGQYEYLVVKNDTQKVAEVKAVKDAKDALDKKIADYNALSAEQQTAQKATYEGEIDTLQAAYNKAVIEARTQFTWGTKADAYVLVSDAQGRFEITGLKAGDYELEEITAPTGYALLKEGVKFNVKDGTYTKDESEKAIHYNKDADTNAQKDALRVDNKKVTIPQTGGIGTVIFTVVGISLMAGAFIAMRKRTAEEN